jgi:hypothetical protein
MVVVLLPHLGETRTLATALKARALLALGNEDFDAFRQDAIAIVRLGRVMTHGATIIEWLVGGNIESMGLDAITRAAAGGFLPAKQVGQIAGDLRALSAGMPLSDVFDLDERVFPLEVLQACAAHGMGEWTRALAGAQVTIPAPADAAGKDWDAAMRRVNAWYDRSAGVRRRPTFAARLAAANEFEADAAALAAKAGKGRQGVTVAELEDRLMVEMMSALGRTMARETRLLVDRDLADVALALSAFRAASGEYPQDLAELAPAYLKAVPVDRFTERPLVYHHEGGGYVLKSVGPNGKDDGGTVGAANDDRAIHAER